MAQSKLISGEVVDEYNKPLEGATIRLIPGNHLTITDSNGAFQISLPSTGTHTLIISYIGYASQKVELNVSDLIKDIHIKLQPEIAQLNEVVIKKDRVTSLKKEESLTIESVNKNFIRQNLSGSLMKSIERIPGISTIGIGSGQSKPIIRGLGFNRVMVVDKGIKHEGQQWGADHGLEIDQFGVARLEVIKGAASFLYGSDAIGGVIDIKPTPVPDQNTLGGSVDLVGKTNNNLFGGSINLYGRGKNLFFNTRITHQNYGDYRVPADTLYVYDYAVRLHKNHLRNSAGNETNLHLDFGLKNEQVQSAFYLSNINSTSGFFANAHGLEPRRVNTALHDASSRDILYPRQKVNHFKIINKSELYFSDQYMMETEIGYQHNFRQEYNQYVNHGYMPPIYPEDTPIPIDLEREFDKHVFSANIKNYLWLGRHEIAVGINSEHQDNSIGGWGFLVPAFKKTLAGAFIHDKYKFNDAFVLNGALRYDYGIIKIEQYNDWFPSTVEQNGETESLYIERAGNEQREFNSIVWSVGASYNKDKFNLKANIGKSFRMPIAKELGANGVNYHYFSYERGNIDLNPEQSYQGDLGLSWTTSKWSVALSPFYNYFSNYIYLNPTSRHDYLYGAGNQVFEYTQSKVLRYGSELQAKWKFHKALSVEVLGEYVYARQLSGDKKGFTLPFSPPPSALFNLEWSPEFADKLNESFLSVDWRVTAKQDNIVPPEKKTKGFNFFNIRAGTTIDVNDNPIAINLQVQNVLNTRYMNHTSFYRLIGLPEAGRNIILSMNIPFNLK
ncbi:TonB-dependent receptor [Marivirga lumbricoides]|uniref:TonB-dependent receptor n=2 Tax=Marivirga lumbricoides TaxID=1046115 RepID=A0ABQ1LN48_9BACT|nr:TonB-dependent receptor [Marivirga lumbricoides]